MHAASRTRIPNREFRYERRSGARAGSAVRARKCRDCRISGGAVTCSLMPVTSGAETSGAATSAQQIRHAQSCGAATVSRWDDDLMKPASSASQTSPSQPCFSVCADSAFAQQSTPIRFSTRQCSTAGSQMATKRIATRRRRENTASKQVPKGCLCQRWRNVV